MKLVAIDLDGTLLSEKGSISPRNKEALLKMQEQGCKVVISSGRSLHDTRHILEKAGIEAPILSGNGAIAAESGKILQSLVLPAGIITELVLLLEREDYYFELYTNKGVIVHESAKGLLLQEISKLQAGDKDYPAEQANRAIEIQYEQYGISSVGDYEGIDFEEAEIYKIFIFSFHSEKLQQLRSKLVGRTDISITTSGRTKLEIAHPQASKGAALQYIANYFGVPLSETAAIGDNFNDLSMFEAAGVSIAMGNAEEEVKRVSTFVTKDCEEDGVAYAVESFLLGQDVKN